MWGGNSLLVPCSSNRPPTSPILQFSCIGGLCPKENHASAAGMKTKHNPGMPRAEGAAQAQGLCAEKLQHIPGLPTGCRAGP